MRPSCASCGSASPRTRPRSGDYRLKPVEESHARQHTRIGQAALPPDGAGGQLARHGSGAAAERHARLLPARPRRVPRERPAALGGERGARHDHRRRDDGAGDGHRRGQGLRRQQHRAGPARLHRVDRRPAAGRRRQRPPVLVAGKRDDGRAGGARSEPGGGEAASARRAARMGNGRRSAGRASTSASTSPPSRSIAFLLRRPADEPRQLPAARSEPRGLGRAVAITLAVAFVVRSAHPGGAAGLALLRRPRAVGGGRSRSTSSARGLPAARRRAPVAAVAVGSAAAALRAGAPGAGHRGAAPACSAWRWPSRSPGGRAHDPHVLGPAFVIIALSVAPPLVGVQIVRSLRTLVQLELDLVQVQSTVTSPGYAVGMMASEELARLDLAAERLLDGVATGRTAAAARRGDRLRGRRHRDGAAAAPHPGPPRDLAVPRGHRVGAARADGDPQRPRRPRRPSSAAISATACSPPSGS